MAVFIYVSTAKLTTIPDMRLNTQSLPIPDRKEQKLQMKYTVNIDYWEA